MRIAFIHKHHNYLTDTYFSQQYRIFQRGLIRAGVDDIEIKSDEINASNYNYDVLILLGVKGDKIPYIKNTGDKKLVACTHDCHSIDEEFRDMAQCMGIKHFFYHHPEKYFRKFADSDWKYKRVFMCIEPDWYKNVVPWKHRVKNKILLTGCINDDKHYKLRRVCKDLDCVRYIPRSKYFEGMNFVNLLNGYCASIAACSTVTVNKTLESMAAGCLTFVECNDDNGWEEFLHILPDFSFIADDEYYWHNLNSFVGSSNILLHENYGINASEKVLEWYGIDRQVKNLLEWIRE